MNAISKFNYRGQAGLTFIELLVSMVAMTVVVAGLGASMVAAVRNPDLSREESQATFILQSTADAIIADRRSGDSAKGYDTLTTTFSTVTLGDSSDDSFTRAVSVTAGSAGSNGCPSFAGSADCKLVTVSVAGFSGLVVQSSFLVMNYD